MLPPTHEVALYCVGLRFARTVWSDLMTCPIRCLFLLVACLIAFAAQAGRVGSQQPGETSSDGAFICRGRHCVMGKGRFWDWG